MEGKMLHGYVGVSAKADYDLESGETLYPGLSAGENQLRWGFVRKVYGILSTQIVLTTVVSSIFVFYSPINDLLRANSGLLLFLVFLPFICTSPTLFILRIDFFYFLFFFPFLCDWLSVLCMIYISFALYWDYAYIIVLLWSVLWLDFEKLFEFSLGFQETFTNLCINCSSKGPLVVCFLLIFSFVSVRNYN